MYRLSDVFLDIQKPCYTWRCAVDQSVLALLGGEGGEG